MRKTLLSVTAISLVFLLAGQSAWAKTDRFHLSSKAKVKSVSLEPGSYQVNIDGNQAEILQRGKILVKAQVSVKQLADGDTPDTVLLDSNGQIQEIRLKKQVIVFKG